MGSAAVSVQVSYDTSDPPVRAESAEVTAAVTMRAADVPVKALDVASPHAFRDPESWTTCSTVAVLRLVLAMLRWGLIRNARR